MKQFNHQTAALLALLAALPLSAKEASDSQAGSRTDTAIRQGNDDAVGGRAKADSERQAVSGPSSDKAKDPTAPAYAAPDPEAINRIVDNWPERPRLGARMMIAKYGPPQDASREELVWHNQVPFKRITVSRDEDIHDFPKPHTDFLQHTVSYRVPSGKAGDLIYFDGSVTFDRTRGELSARCDLEEHNILSLNLANDVVNGTRTGDQARHEFSRIAVQELVGQPSEMVTALKFQPPTEPAADPDRPTIPGSPHRAPADAGPTVAGDAEVLGFLIAIDENEILAANIASKKKISGEAMGYVKMLRDDHGANLVKTMQLGDQMMVVPLETAAVDELRRKGAGDLAAIVGLEGDQFEGPFIKAMIKGHTEAIQTIDNKLLKEAQSDGLQAQLRKTREQIASHLEAGRKLQASTARND